MAKLNDQTMTALDEYITGFHDSRNPINQGEIDVTEDYYTPEEQLSILKEKLEDLKLKVNGFRRVDKSNLLIIISNDLNKIIKEI